MSSQTFKFKSNIIAQKMDGDQYILFDGKKSIIYTCNETASLIIDLLMKKKNIEEIVIYINTRYEIDIKKIKKDVLENVKYLLKNKLIIPEESI